MSKRLRIIKGADEGKPIVEFLDETQADTLVSGGYAEEDLFWDDLRVPLTATRLGASRTPGWAQFKDNGAGSTGVYTNWFDKNTEEEMFFEVELPNSYKEGTDIEAHVHWTPNANGAGQVSWGLEYTWQNIAGTFGNTTIIYGDTPLTGGSLVADLHYLTPIADISGTGKTNSSMIVGRVFRDATGAGGTDDYADDAGLLEVDFHYQMDAPGSRTQFEKG